MIVSRWLRMVALGVSGLAWTSTLNAQEAAKTPVSGIELEYISKQVRPGDDFYTYVNDEWLKKTEIPADKSNYGSFTALDDATIDSVRAIILESAADPKSSPQAEQVGSLYQSYKDVAARNAAGIKPIQPMLDKIKGIKTIQDWCRVAGELERVGVGSIAGFMIEPDARNSDAYGIYVYQSGTSLPDRDYYLVKNERNDQIMQEFHQYVSELLKMAGHADPKNAATAIIGLESKFAEVQWSKVDMRDPVKSYNKKTASEFASSMKNLDWAGFGKAIGCPDNQDLIVGQPSFFAAIDKIVGDTPLQTMKDFLFFSTVDAFAPSLSEQFETRHFAFHQTVLTGVTEQKPLERRAIELCNGLLGMPIGQIYVERHFSPKAKERMQGLVNNLIAAYEQRIGQLEWMGAGTKKQAKEKLSMFTTKIGYPDKWKDYSKIKLTPVSLVGNLLAVFEFEHNYQLNKLGKPIDRTEWLMTPQTINAYYNPVMNEIVFPAAILQPPFFNMEADDAVNYGGIGAVIGHEISHGFDDSGRKFDGKGNLRNWWTEEDRTEFEKRATQLTEQYSAFRPFEDMNVNGELTLGENIGDLGGVNVSFAAYQLSLGGKPAPVIDGLTGEQRFFMGYAQIWRRKYREQELRRRLLTDPHSPSQYRVLGIVSNMEAFYEAFGVKEGDKMYIAPENRVRIW
jgi:putative endopeptidase